MVIRVKKYQYGYLQGTCDKCGEDDLPLTKNDGLVVCDTCINTIKRVEAAKKRIEDDNEDKAFIDRAINY